MAWSFGCSDSSSTSPPVVGTPVDPATAGSIRIEVVYKGDPPAAKEISMRSAPQCAAAHDGPVYDQSLLVTDHHLQNAVVWIKKGLDSWVFSPPSEPVMIDQKGCLYEPRVAAAMVHQPIVFRNSDAEAHNVHGRPQILSTWNFMMSRPGATRTLTFDKPEVGVPIGCDIHPWMAGSITVVGNPYFGVTKADGIVNLTKVPPGDYVVGVWHEKLGVKEQPVTLSPSGTASLKFELGG
ncbi:MAG: hypothetical protein HY270_14365 [Deltaproteobacteria bacterium]|nr:hypothetical protein [Deltaproteobacteria bacterium]